MCIQDLIYNSPMLRDLAFPISLLLRLHLHSYCFLEDPQGKDFVHAYYSKKCLTSSEVVSVCSVEA